MEMSDGRFYCLKPCDNDYHDPEFDPGVRTDIRTDKGMPEPLSAGDEELILAKIANLIRDGNRFKKIKDVFKNMLEY
jgi:hypothetical protein